MVSPSELETLASNTGMAEKKPAISARAKATSVTLRPFAPSDIDDFWEWASDDEVTRFLRLSSYSSKDSLQHYISDYVISHPFYRAVCLGGRPVGALWVTPGEDGFSERRGQLGYVLAREWWGCGVTAAAIRAAVPLAFAAMPRLLRIEALVDVANVRSLRVLEKAGFRKEGVLRQYWTMKWRTVDNAIYSILSTDLGGDAGDPVLCSYV